jgi:hypothetical protein
MKVDISRESLNTMSKEELVAFILTNKDLYDPIIYTVAGVKSVQDSPEDLFIAEYQELASLIESVIPGGSYSEPGYISAPILQNLNTSVYPKDWMRCEVVTKHPDITVTKYNPVDYEGFIHTVDQYFETFDSNLLTVE